MNGRNRMMLALAALAALTLAFAAFAEAPASAPMAPGMSSAPGEHKHFTTSNVKPEDQVDINSATKEQLMKLPGIGEAYAERIIKNRPYRMKTELLHRRILPQAEFQKIMGLIVAKQPPKTAGAPTATTPAAAPPAPPPAAATTGGK